MVIPRKSRPLVIVVYFGVVVVITVVIILCLVLHLLLPLLLLLSKHRLSYLVVNNYTGCCDCKSLALKWLLVLWQ